jgi:hypothetical protein
MAGEHEETQELYERLAMGLLYRAKIIRAQYKYSEDKKMAQCAGIVGEGASTSGMIPMFWKDEEEKRRLFLALSMTAKQTNAKAVFLIADSRWTNSTLMCEHFNLPNPLNKGDKGFEDFKREYQKVMSRHNYEIRRLPRHLWNEAVIVALKGPGIKPILRLASYVEGKRDTVEWLKEPPIKPDDESRAQINLLPDWWTVQ